MFPVWELVWEKLWNKAESSFEGYCIMLRCLDLILKSPIVKQDSMCAWQIVWKGWGIRKAEQSETSKEIIAIVQADDDENLRKGNECTRKLDLRDILAVEWSQVEIAWRQFGDRCSGFK